jgi:hypothetical protein
VTQVSTVDAAKVKRLTWLKAKRFRFSGAN